MDAHHRDPLAVDVIMRTKDRPLLLARAIDDVLAQTHSSWSLTIVNDGGLASAVDEVIQRRSTQEQERIRVLHNPRSLGMEAAANQVLRSTDARWVAIHDDDDSWDASFLDVTTSWLSQHPDAPAVAVRTEIVWEEIAGDTVRELGREVFLPQLDQVTLAQLVRFNCCVPISVLYRRESLQQVGLFDEDLRVVGDWECHLRLAAVGAFGFLSERPLAFWHQRPDAHGAFANSVIGQRDDHRRADRVVRDRELRKTALGEGLGVPLYLTRYLDDRFDELHQRLDQIEQRERARIGSRVRRWIRTLLRKGGGS